MMERTLKENIIQAALSGDEKLAKDLIKTLSVKEIQLFVEQLYLVTDWLEDRQVGLCR
jgi:hypothetical protein